MSLIPPEIPPPGPDIPRPDHGTPPVPLWPALVDEDPAVNARSALLRQRRVLLTGTLDDHTVTRAATELMLLDGESSQQVELIVNSDGGPLPDVLALLDVVSLMRAPVATRCIGRAVGTAAVVLASGTAGRGAAANAMITLRLRERYDVDGRAIDVERFAGHLAGVRERIEAHLAAVTDLRGDDIRYALDDSGPLSAEMARDRGIIDEVLSH
ncbi:MAG TPA: ATP-dependent Clp protease proteolytic subunit [Euzebyales bacterium]|nr:ATP-dependent Clp protease proteolytic subunit [Euzebyales bacterium]